MERVSREGRSHGAAASDRPWFLWDLPVTEQEFRGRLHSPDSSGSP
jgi:hypothetical protein